MIGIADLRIIDVAANIAHILHKHNLFFRGHSTGFSDPPQGPSGRLIEEPPSRALSPPLRGHNSIIRS